MQQHTKKPILKESTTRYKLVLTSGLLDKIEFLCRKYTRTEWSGILFYKPEGSLEENNLVLTAVDLYIRDVGSTGSTEFSLTPDITTYMIGMDLIGTQMGLIHSHHSMETFFSGTDTATLLEEGEDRNHFLSLIVNNAGTYSAKFTRKIRFVSETNYSYPTFEGVEVKGVVNTEETIVEAFNLDITKESRDFPDIEEALKLIEEEKKAKVKIPAYPGVYPYPRYPAYSPVAREVSAGPANLAAQQDLPFSKNSTKTGGDGREDNLEEDEVLIEGENNHLYPVTGIWPDEIPYGKVVYNKDALNKALSQLLLCSPVVLSSKFEPKKFIGSMKFHYDKTFAKVADFYEMAGSVVEYILWYSTDENIESMGVSIEEEQAILAHDLLEEINKLPTNEYLEYYKTLLKAYLL